MTEILVNDQVQEMERVFQLQKKNQWKMKNTSAVERIELLGKLRTALELHREEIDQALFQDLGRPKNSAEVYMVIKELDYTTSHLEEWMSYEVHDHPTIPTAKYYVQYEPRGVVLLLGAWNFPLDLVFSPLVALLAAGNTAIVKANEVTPNCSAMIAKVIKHAFDEEVVACFEGGIEVAHALEQLPFDHIFFTGSPKVGKSVMEAASKNLTSVTLELGGRSPLVLDETANLQSVAQGVGICKTVNAGQICLAVNHIFAPRSKVDELVSAISAYLKASCYESEVYQPEKVGKIVDARNFDRVTSYISDTLEKGASIVFGGNHDKSILSIEPTIITDVTLDSALVQNEIFAPVIPIVAYDDIHEVIDFINDGGKPLGLFIFSNNQPFIDHVINHTSCGGITINGWAMHASTHELPFGGVNQSGMGSYHGVHGFKELSHARPIFKTY
jgi:aldehyde dehydrogenase (NAD+)